MRHCLYFMFFLLGATVFPSGSVAAERPNIVFLLADDLGWEDVSFHKGQIKTPNLDKLADGGAKLEQFYVQPVCSPTRASLMTGRYPMRYGLQVNVIRPWATYGLPLEERTLPQALKDVGYTTAICGKWHLGHFQPEYLPTKRGFDHQYGHYNGALDYFTHIRDGGFDWHRDDKVCRDEGYSTHLLAKEAVRLIEEQKTDKPLFLYVPFNAVHDPLQVPEKYMEPYSNLTGGRRKYAGMTAALDEACGWIIDAIDKRGLRKNTLFIFSSDNGGPVPGVITSNGPYRAGKATLYEGGVRVAAFATWEGRIKAGSVVNEPLHMVDWYPTLLKLGGASLEQKLPLDGLDAWATIADGKPTPHKEILHNTSPHAGALRQGDWKLVINGTTGSGNARPAKETVELFNMADDPYEKKNLAAEKPEKVKQMRDRYEVLAKEAVKPKTSPIMADFKAPKVWGEKD